MQSASGVKKGIKLEMGPGGLEILQEGRVDFYTFSYYMTNAMTTHKTDETVGGNLFGGVKNPYLKASDWAGRSIQRACGTH